MITTRSPLLIFRGWLLLATASLVFPLSACGERGHNLNTETKSPMDLKQDTTTQFATFGAGCFWCVEAMFESLQGVHEAVSGYSGGHVKNPSYKEVCSGNTGHAEVVRIVFDPASISYEELLKAFFMAHDPTTLNRQGADVGTQYRSVIFFHDSEQERLAREVKSALDASGSFPSPIVTEISPAVTFYPAEDYHQEYFANNPNQPYCAMVVGPKLEKFRKVFRDRLK
jgi:peptide-methionine (S)-S-oxide reductase